jgi:hypothetical protein
MLLTAFLVPVALAILALSVSQILMSVFPTLAKTALLVLTLPTISPVFVLLAIRALSVNRTLTNALLCLVKTEEVVLML